MCVRVCSPMCVAACACACACCSIAITRAPSPGSFSPHSLFILSHNIPSTTPTSETRLLSSSLLPLLDSLLLVPRLYVFLFCSLFLLFFICFFLLGVSFLSLCRPYSFVFVYLFHLHHRSRHRWLHCIVDLLFHRYQHFIISLLSLLPSSLSSHHHLHYHHHHCRRPFPWP